MGSSPSTAGIKKKSLTPTESSGLKGSVTIQGQKELCCQSVSESSSEDKASMNTDALSPSCVINLAKHNMLEIEERYTEKGKECSLTVDFQKATLSLNKHISVFYPYETFSENAVIFQTLIQHIQEHRTVQIYCAIFAELLESETWSEYPVISPQHIGLVSTLLDCLVDLCDNNYDISTIISGQTHFLRIAIKKLEQLKNPHFCDTITQQQNESSILETLCNILYNISMFEDNVSNLRDVNCIEALKPYLKSKNNSIRLLCLAALANLVNESESEILTSGGDVIKYLMGTISMTIEAGHRLKEGWSLMELVRIVRQVARNDNNKRTVVQHGAVPLLVKILDNGRIEEQREAVRAIWTLSFDKQNKKEMIEKKEWNVIETLERFSKSSDETIKMIIKKSLWTIEGHQNTCQSLQPTPGFEDSKETGSGNRHIMISYNWKHQDKVKKIRDSLKNIGHRVWMDVDDMHGSTLDAMAKAVEQADIVLMCYSSKYKNSDSCRVEAEYAYKRKKEIIPLKMEMNYEPDGWLGLIIGTKLFYELSGKYRYMDKVNELFLGVQNALDSSSDLLVDKLTLEPIPQFELPVVSAPKPKEEKSNIINIVRKWTPSQVEKWLDNNNLPKKLLGRLRGKDIAFLRLLAIQSHNTFYQTIREQLNIKDIKSMSDFLFPLEDIDTDMTDLHSSSSL